MNSTPDNRALGRGLTLGILIGVAVGVVVGAAVGIHAQSADLDIDTAAACEQGVGCTERPDVLAEVDMVANEAGVSAGDLLGALNSLHAAGLDVSPRTYLIGEGLLAPPVPPKPACAWPICGALGQRIFCIEKVESNHGLAMWNPVGLLWPDGVVRHAHGWLGWMDPTAAAWGAAVGNRASEWQAAARMLAAGAGGAFYGIASGRC